MRPTPPGPEVLSDYDYLGFDGSPPRHRMGLRRLDHSNWLEPDRQASAQREIKRRLIAERRGEVVLDAETSAAAAGVAELATWLDLKDEADIVTCGLATQEDWCVMVNEDAWRLRAACVCFPSRWVLSEKAGGTIAEIHQPVPRYHDELGGLVESFMDRLTLERSVWRLNWNLWDDSRLFQPTEDPSASDWEPPELDEVGDRIILRVERQTLRRLTEDAIAFGIRVHQRPLASLVNQPGAVEQLSATIGGANGLAGVTKKLGRLADPISRWLASIESAA